MVMPVQKPGRSKQDYGTPWELIRAVEARFGKLTIDLAANRDGSNAKAPRWLWDSLTVNWEEQINVPFCEPGIGWLNPPFSRLGKWSAKCRDEAARGARIIMLTPASISSEWFAKYVESECRVLIVGMRPRITFEECAHPYPKDCMLTLWGFFKESAPVVPFATWRWRESKRRKKAA